MAHPAAGRARRVQEWNVRIHDIRAWQVADARGSEQLDRLCGFGGADVLVADNAGVDLNVLRRACEVTDDEPPPYRSLCILQVARKVYDLNSYQLPLASAAAGFGAFPHHAARACAQIVIDAAQRSGAESVDELATSLGLRLAAPSALAAARRR